MNASQQLSVTRPPPFSEDIPRLAARIHTLLRAYPSNKRLIIAIGGIPGSGKTTLTALLTTHLNTQTPNLAVALPMDGFHYPRSHLATFPNAAEALARRGAPFTFDARAWVRLIGALTAYPTKSFVAVTPEGVTGVENGEMGVYAPSFHHSLKDPVANGVVVREERVVICEGNYLLMKGSEWERVIPMYGARWLVECDRETAKRRLVRRHLEAGIAKTEEQAVERAEKNDLVNGKEMLDNLVEVDERIWNDW